MPQTIIRLAMSADVCMIQEIVEDAYAPYVARIGRKPAPMTDDYAECVRVQNVWVLETSNGIAGLIVLRKKADHLLVSNVAVGRAYQGLGFGKALLEFANAFAARNGRRELRLYTNELMHENLVMYSRLGWEEYERAEQNGFRRVLMRKQIAQSVA